MVRFIGIFSSRLVNVQADAHCVKSLLMHPGDMACGKLGISTSHQTLDRCLCKGPKVCKLACATQRKWLTGFR